MQFNLHLFLDYKKYEHAMMFRALLVGMYPILPPALKLVGVEFKNERLIAFKKFDMALIIFSKLIIDFVLLLHQSHNNIAILSIVPLSGPVEAGQRYYLSNSLNAFYHKRKCV